MSGISRNVIVNVYYWNTRKVSFVTIVWITAKLFWWSVAELQSQSVGYSSPNHPFWLRFPFEWSQQHQNLINDKFPHEQTFLVSQRESLSASLECCTVSSIDSVSDCVCIKTHISLVMTVRKYFVYVNERLIDSHYLIKIVNRSHVHKRRQRWVV